MINNKNYIIIHHSATSRDKTTFEAVNNYHRQRWGLESELGYYIGYHYFIDSMGKVWQGRNNYEIGAHCKEHGMNYKSVGICLAGNFDNEWPSTKQLLSLQDLLIILTTLNNISSENIKYHRFYANYKSCPGKNIGDNYTNLILAKNLYTLVKVRGNLNIYAKNKNTLKLAKICNVETLKLGYKLGLWKKSLEIVEQIPAEIEPSIQLVKARNC